MKKRKETKEIKELVEILNFHLLNYKTLKAIHHETIDNYIDFLVEKLKELSK
ncbi:MAG: hypothetical protein LBJ63_04850 [Prevotellaceae bacterium]|jgi:hypothetical protein|nr:hypothetical protein [Prevotellaceae bacterium]